MKLREKQMQERRTRILDTAERLIRLTGSTDFSVRHLAAEAEVSPTTPFNLFGSKEGILYTLLLRTLDVFTERGLAFKDKDSDLHFVEASLSAANILITDAKFFRPLYQVLMGVTHPTHRPVFMRQTFQYWRLVAESVPCGRTLQSDRNRDLLAHSLMSHFTGLMEMWINRDLSNKAFRGHVICAAITDAFYLMPKPLQAKMKMLLDETSQELTFSFGETG